ncbi:MAG TPA: hypothetical protein VKH46_13955 [Thermoanaerobaculia bacterium]|nr:hypothetical protein [Thermoanaerobaculia bacterium]
MTRKTLPIIGTLPILALLVGCLVPPPPGVAYVRRPPPPARVEVIERSPGPDYVWIGGHQAWVAGTYVWSPGHWERRPRARARWVPGHWRHNRSGYYWVEGHWR